MTTSEHLHQESASSDIHTHRVGYYSALLTAVITMVTFGFAITAVPISGASCPGNCVDYPYLNTASQYPKDFLWMPLAMLMVLVYLMLMATIHTAAPANKKIFTQIGLAFALIAALLLLTDYFVQFSVIPVSLIHGETEGLAALIQYNPHGLFIALEELGYLMMSLSFLFMAAVFSEKNRLETAVRWIFILGFVLAIISLVVILIIYGLEREYLFEVAIISIDWLVLIINGVLLSRIFRNKLQGYEAIV